jgi:hypothetical protein
LLLIKRCSKDVDNLSIYGSLDYLKNAKNGEFLINRFCGVNRIPPPFITEESARRVRLSFFSDGQNYARGFNLSYTYERVKECKYFYDEVANSSSGEIKINKSFNKLYTCDWFITVKPGKSVIFSFKNYNLGKYKLKS